MLLSVEHSALGVILRVKLLNSSVSTGAGLTGLTFNSAGLVVSAIADSEASTTTYAQASSNIEDITTLGTFAAPTTNKCRFKPVDATNHPGVYEIQIANAKYAVSSARSLLVSVRGATDLAECDFTIQLDNLNTAIDAFLKRDMSALTGEAARSPLNALRFLRNRWVISGGTLTVYEEDDTTVAWTASLTTNAAADPVTSSDPA